MYVKSILMFFFIHLKNRSLLNQDYVGISFTHKRKSPFKLVNIICHLFVAKEKKIHKVLFFPWLWYVAVVADLVLYIFYYFT